MEWSVFKVWYDVNFVFFQTTMKTQDQSLIHQFKLLRSAITELKDSATANPNYDLASSCQSLPITGCQPLSLSTCQSLDLGLIRRDWSPMSEKDILLDFKSRTSPSASSPCTPNMERDVIKDFITPPSSAKISRAVWSAAPPRRGDKQLGIWYVWDFAHHAVITQCVERTHR